MPQSTEVFACSMVAHAAVLFYNNYGLFLRVRNLKLTRFRSFNKPLQYFILLKATANPFLLVGSLSVFNCTPFYLFGSAPNLDEARTTNYKQPYCKGMLTTFIAFALLLVYLYYCAISFRFLRLQSMDKVSSTKRIFNVIKIVFLTFALCIMLIIFCFLDGGFFHSTGIFDRIIWYIWISLFSIYFLLMLAIDLAVSLSLIRRIFKSSVALLKGNDAAVKRYAGV